MIFTTQYKKKHLPAGKIFIAIEKASGPVQRVACVVDRRAFFWRFMRRTQEDPLLGRRHLGAGGRKTLRL